MKNKDKILFYEGLACAFRSWMTSTAGFDEVRKVMLQRAMELKDDKLFCGLVATYYRLLNEEHERDLSFIENSIEISYYIITVGTKSSLKKRHQIDKKQTRTDDKKYGICKRKTEHSEMRY